MASEVGPGAQKQGCLDGSAADSTIFGARIKNAYRNSPDRLGVKQFDCFGLYQYPDAVDPHGSSDGDVE
jgi:hypothetical protein